MGKDRERRLERLRKAGYRRERQPLTDDEVRRLKELKGVIQEGKKRGDGGGGWALGGGGSPGEARRGRGHRQTDPLDFS